MTCSYRVRGVDGSYAKHLTIEFYTVVMLLTFMHIIISIQSLPHCFIPGLKPPFSANPSHRNLSFIINFIHRKNFDSSINKEKIQTDSTDSPDGLPIGLVLSISVFTV